MAEFSPQNEIHKVWGLVEELFRHVLHDEEPLFISDEATLWDVSMSDPNEILARCVTYYGVPVSMQDTRQPLWRLLPMVDERRRAFSLRSDPLKAVDDIRSAQQNVLVRDILKNAQRVDEVLWNGSRDAPRVQRIGSIAIGLLLILCGVSSALTATRQHYLFEIVLTFAFVGIGLRIALNGLQRSRGHQTRGRSGRVSAVTPHQNRPTL